MCLPSAESLPTLSGSNQSPKRHKLTMVTLIIGIIVGLIISSFIFCFIHLFQVQHPRTLSLNQFNSLHSKNSLNAENFTDETTATLSVTSSPTKFALTVPKSTLPQQEFPSSMPQPHSHHPRYEELSKELLSRKILFVGVLTTKKHLNTRALGIYRTWGKEVPDLKFFSSQPDDNNSYLPIITLPGVDDTHYPPLRKVYHMLKYMHDHYINEFDFFMRSSDEVYVKVDMMIELLKKTNPAQDIYMGSPGFGRPDDRNRINLTEEEHYCMGGPGVIFSRSALQKLAPYLDECLKVQCV